MGHQSNDARKALRAYARDLHSTAGRGSFVSPVGTSKRDDAPNQFLGSGAPHQLAIAAAVVCVVLLGGIGLATATNSTDETTSELANPQAPRSASGVTVFATNGSVSSVTAIQAFNALGLTRAADALDAAATAGADSSPAVQQALGRLLEIIDARLETAEAVNENEVTISLAIGELEAAARPPGLDPEWLAPGQGGTPPGLDPKWLDHARSTGILHSAEGSILNLPERNQKDRDDNGRDTAPGQQKDEPAKGDGKP